MISLDYNMYIVHIHVHVYMTTCTRTCTCKFWWNFINTIGERTGSFSDFICLKPDQVIHETESEGIGTASSTQDDVTFNDIHEPLVVKESTGCPSIDRVLLQHLLHCEYLLQVINNNHIFVMIYIHVYMYMYMKIHVLAKGVKTKNNYM